MSHIEDDLGEASLILKGSTRQEPEVRHLRALNESRLYWREAAMTRRHVPPVPLEPKREVMVNRINAFFNWLDRLSDVQHAVFVVFVALVCFGIASACLTGVVQGARMVLR